jgi:pimeloyl-ACP methyl ester carboxylesterase
MACSAGKEIIVPLDHDLTDVTHGMADIEPGLRLHYVTAGRGTRTVVLLHGFPQTWWEWRHVIPALVAGGFRVVAPDYRGAGHSWCPPGGYEKQTMAKDIHQLLRQELWVEGPVVLVGHDIGLMVVYTYAQAHSSGRLSSPAATPHHPATGRVGVEGRIGALVVWPSWSRGWRILLRSRAPAFSRFVMIRPVQTTRPRGEHCCFCNGQGPQGRPQRSGHRPDNERTPRPCLRR